MSRISMFWYRFYSKRVLLLVYTKEEVLEQIFHLLVGKMLDFIFLKKGSFMSK